MPIMVEKRPLASTSNSNDLSHTFSGIIAVRETGPHRGPFETE